MFSRLAGGVGGGALVLAGGWGAVVKDKKKRITNDPLFLSFLPVGLADLLCVEPNDLPPLGSTANGEILLVMLGLTGN
jgi:hypothetical protein